MKPGDLLFLLLVTSVRAALNVDVNTTANGWRQLVKDYAAQTWNCDGNRPPCPGCSTVGEGSGQSPYGCAPYVAHCLAAAGQIGLDSCGTLGPYSSYQHGGKSYDLNVVKKEDPNCGEGNLCLMDLLLDMGWQQTSQVREGTVCAVKGDVNWGHIVIGVGPGHVSAHNVAHASVPISNYQIDLCLDPNGDAEELLV